MRFQYQSFQYLTIIDELNASTPLLDAQVDAECQIKSLQSRSIVTPWLLCIHHKLPQTLVDDRVKEGKVMEPDRSSQDVLKM